MAGLRIYLSNRMEKLAEELAGLLGEPLSSPLKKDIVVVQSKGMEHWVSMELARYHGICTNVHFPFPKAFVHQILTSVISEFQPDTVFDPHVMAWEIMKLIPSCLDRDSFESIKSYLEDDENCVKRFQLAHQIAYLFDQYLIFRPEMIVGWEKGEVGQKDEKWQADLWRELVRDRGNHHPAAYRDCFFRKISSDSFSVAASLPERIAVFGISALPRFYLEIIYALSKRIDVHLFAMTPSREFWGDIRSDREIHRELTKLETTSGKDVSYEYLHLERGNSLLASMGAAGRDYFKLILDLQDQVEEYFIEPIEDNMLSMAASDIFHLRDRGDTDSNKGIIGWEDRSIEILSCHSPMREVEVLYDHLLLMFDKNPDLSPKDVLVMTPDMDTYAPFIHAVFGAPSGRIPFSIADRTIGKEGAITKGFLEILGLVDSRFEVSQVLSLLEISSIRDRFDLSEGDMARIRKLVSDSRICWGIDEIDRERLGLPATRENTWMAGLDRLILGYAMPGQEERLFKGILPYDYIEGGETKILGQFLTFTRLLFNDVASLGQPRSIELWSRDLKTLLEHFFIANEETQGEMQIIRRALHQLSAVENQIRFHEAVGLDVICCYLERVLGSQGHDYGFMTGGVTFCAMLPMRSIPFKVICLVGMNNTAYPRQSETVGFNLIVQNPKPGDQTHRDSDRYLFLETIISAREKLYISYVGQSMEDNTAIPPSALVCELMDYLEQGFMFPDAGSVLDKIATVHHLQAFNPSYFTGDQNLFSYSEENCRAARCLLEQSSPPAGLVPHSLSKPAEDWKIVELSDLLSFYRNPARFLSERRLGIGLEDASPLMEEVEPFKLSQLERYIFEQTIIEQALKGKELKAFYRLANAAGRLPHGQVGICAYDHLVESVRPFIEMLKHRLKGEKTEPLEFDLPVADFLLKGTIASLYPGGLIHYRFATLRGKDHLRFWIEHLVLNAVEGADVRQSFLFGKDEAWEMMPVAEASKWLATLVKQFWIGLMTPLKFFPEAAWIYVQQVYEKGKSPQEGIRKARERWVGNDFSPGEGEDAYYQLCFGEIEPLDSVFQKLAELIMSPLLQYQRKIKT